MSEKNPYAEPVDQYIRDAQAKAAADSAYWHKFYRRLDLAHATLTGCLIFMAVLLVGWCVFGAVVLIWHLY